MKTSKTKPRISPSLPAPGVVDDLLYVPAFYSGRAINPDIDFQKNTNGILFSKYLPAGIVVTELMEVAHFRGEVDNYLQNLDSKPYTNLLTIVKKELVTELRDILGKVKERNTSVTIENIPLSIHGSIRNISIEAIQLPDTKTPHYLILFHDNGPAGKLTVDDGKKNTAKTKKEPGYLRIQQLELQLMQTRRDMRSITDTQEATNEELRKANDELLSSSEDLQTLNDELESSKDELETTNDALNVLNLELNSLNDQVTAGRNYTDSIIATMMEPILVLDKQFFIKSANRAFYKTFDVNELQTVGVRIYDLGSKQWDIPKLHTLLEELLPQKRRITDYKITRNFPGIGERIMQLNASEIIRDRKEEKLILLSIQDITEKAQLHLKEQEFQRQLEEKVRQRTKELRDTNEELQQKNQEIALSKYNKRFLTEFSEKYSSNMHDNEFFNSLVQFIADTTRLDYVFVGKLVQNTGGEPFIETISFSAFGKLIGNISYALAGSPCEQVISGKMNSFTEKCGRLFLNSKMPGQSKIEAYLGQTLNDRHGKPVGLITVMNEKSIQDAESIFPVLKIVARRAEIELERITYGEELVIRNRENEKQAAELIIINKSLAFQIEEKEKRAAELLKANKELESFAYISSHDLQEPLRKIQTFANRILESESVGMSANGKDYLNRMNSAAKRMRALINDVLAYSRTKSVGTESEEVNLAVVITEVINEFAEIILEKNAVIEVGELSDVWINISQFKQLLNNLLANALKFCNPGVVPRIKITGKIVKAIQFQSDNPGLPDGMLSPQQIYYQITISDNGIGFDPQYKEKIFEVFQRLHSKEEYEGTGIGLAIVKKIVENHNGTITARSEPGKGATFDIYLPFL